MPSKRTRLALLGLVLVGAVALGVSWFYTARQVPTEYRVRPAGAADTARSSDFVDLGGRGGAENTAALSWDRDALHVHFAVEDVAIVSTLKRRDADLWTEDVVELFVDPRGDGGDYYEFQVSASGVVFDAYFTGHRSDLSRARRWNAEGLEAGVARTPGGWEATLTIPFAALGGAPQTGERWPFNLYRIDFHPNEKPDYYAWTPPGVPDFHHLEGFGTLVFSE